MRRSAVSFGLATAFGHASQLLWLVVGIRVMPAADFGAVLAAQALYAVLQIVVDVGPNAIGTRLAARGQLDAALRAEVLRMRLLLALAIAPVAVALGVIGISGTLAGTLPFVVALSLFAVLNIWEPYGQGDARPWASYTFARSAVLAVVACAFLVADRRFPVPLAGVLECVAILAIMAIFGRATLTDLRLAARARARASAWRSALWIGGPAATAQSSLAAGTLVLTGAGRPALAAVYAGCVRLLSGINAVNAVLAMSLYPRLASDAAGEAIGDGDRVLSLAFRLIAFLATALTAVCALGAAPIAVALLKTSTDTAQATLVLVVAAALPLGTIVMFNYQMIAHGRERATLTPFALGGGLTVAAAIAIVAVTDGREDLVAASLLGGQLATMALLGARVQDAMPGVIRETRRAMLLAGLVGLLACTTLLPAGTHPAGGALLVLATVMAWALRPFAGTLFGRMRSAVPQTQPLARRALLAVAPVLGRGLTVRAWRTWEGVLTLRSRDRDRGRGRDRADDGLDVPPAALRVRVIAQADREVFLSTGRAEAAVIAAAASAHGLEIDASGRLLDFGCGCGRVTRHWHAYPSVEVHGTDHDADLIDWLRTGLPFVHAARNDLAPPLPYPDAHFGIVYAISVFTHMTDDLARAWMIELARIIRPGGLLLFTALDDRQVDRLRPDERDAYARGESVVQFVDALGTNMCVAYHPRAFIETIAPQFSILSTQVIGAQELYVLRSRSRADQAT